MATGYNTGRGRKWECVGWWGSRGVGCGGWPGVSVRGNGGLAAPKGVQALGHLHGHQCHFLQATGILGLARLGICSRGLVGRWQAAELPEDPRIEDKLRRAFNEAWFA